MNGEEDKSAVPEIFKWNVKRAAANVIDHGDTDVFPYSFENVLIRKNTDSFVKLIEELSINFEIHVNQTPPQFESLLSPVGYNGYRWITQIDPYWNCYILASLIRHGTDLESARIPEDDHFVHSYRYNPDKDDSNLFNRSFNWRSFMQQSYLHAQNHSHVIITDISEFYRRIYHHRVENALERVCSTNIPDKIIKLLSIFSLGTSYGLPVGGPASRILAETIMNQIDILLQARGMNFCRFVDDFHIFADSEESAHRNLQKLTELLIINQGLNLQKSKTRIMKSSEFIATFPRHLVPGNSPSGDRERLFSLDLNYDPYSPTAAEDYAALKASVSSIDFMSLLNEELQKSQVHTPTAMKLIRALKGLSPDIRIQAIQTMITNLEILYPVMSHLLIVLNSISSELSHHEIRLVCEKILDLSRVNSYILDLDIHKSYAVRILSKYKSYEVDALFTSWLENGCAALKRDVIIAFAARGGWDHLSDFKNRTAGQTPWVRRAMIAVSYGLGDEGKHWRNVHVKDHFDRFVQETCGNFRSEEYGQLL
jgi:hypothetical protein